MAGRSKDLRIAIIGDTSQLNRALKSADGSLDKLGKQTTVFSRVTSRGFATTGLAAKGMAAGFLAAGYAAKKAVDGASDINESLSKNQVLFGKNAKAIDAFSKTTASALGISRRETLEAAGTFGNLFTALDIAPKKSADMSKSLITLAADMASFNNASPEEVLEAIRSGLVGETEPLRKFGVNLSDATLRTQALSMGLVKNTKEALTPQTKALAVNALLIKQTEKAHGDFGRTSAGLANQQRILKATFKDTTDTFGKALLPTFTKAVQTINRDVAPAFKHLASDIGRIFDRKDLDLGEKLTLSGAAIQKNLSPLGNELAKGLRRADLGDKLGKAFEVAAPAIADALARSAPHAAGAFVNAFKKAGPWGKLLTAGFIISKLGGFSAAGKWASAQLAESFVDRLPASMKARDGEVRKQGTRSGKMLGRAAGVGAAIGLAFILSDLAKQTGLKQYSGKDGWGELYRDIKRRGAELGKGLVRGIVSGIAGIGSSIGNKLGSIAKSLTPWGDGIGKDLGKNLQLPSGGAFGGSLMGARTSLRPFAAIGSQFGLSVTSGLRPGAITSSNNVSYHSSGEAIDESGSPAGMLRFFRYMKSKFGSRLAELIHTPGGIGIKDGRPFRYTGKVAADHYDHVHVALDTGAPGVGDGIGRVRGALIGDGIGKTGLVNLWTKAGGPASAANLAAAVALAESGGNPNASNRNTDGTIDRGLWQINSVHGALSVFGQLANARAAVQISKHGRDWSPWVAYTSDAYKKFLKGSVKATAKPEPRGPGLEVAGSRLVNKISAPFFRDSSGHSVTGGGLSGPHLASTSSPGIRSLSRTAGRLGAQLAQGEVYYGQAERAFGMSEEDLGTAAGRTEHIRELSSLKAMKKLQLTRQKKRAAAIKKEIAKYKGLIKAINKKLTGKNRIKGVEAAKMRERRRTYDDALVDLQAELQSLDNETVDTQLDIDELEKDITDTAATPDTPPDTDPGGGPGDVGDSGGNAGGDSGAQALADAINGLRGDIQAQLAFAQSVVTMENYQLHKGLADIVGGYIVGSDLAGRSLTAGSGVRFRV